jgi:uncharacterized repeat protein (TIGR01451 family)
MNTGNVTLTNVQVTDNQGVTVTCPYTTLAPAASVVCSALGIAARGQYANIGYVTASPPTGPNVTNSDPSHYFGVAPDLVITKSDSGASAQPATVLIYTLSYSNAGTQVATGVTLTDIVPANTTFSTTGSSGGWSCAEGALAGATCTLSAGTLSPGASGSKTFAVRVNPSVPSELTQISNSATIADDGQNGPDLTPGNNTGSDTTQVDASVQLTLTKVRQNTPSPGVLLEYSLIYANDGGREATGVTLRETVPANTTFHAGASSDGWSCSGGGIEGSACTYALGSLDGGAGGTVTFAVTVDIPLAAGTPIANTATLDDDKAGGAVQDSDSTTVARGPVRVIVNEGAYVTWQFVSTTYGSGSGPLVVAWNTFLPLILKPY